LLESFQAFFENMGPLGLLLYAILETISLIPPTEVIQMPMSVSSSRSAGMLFWLAFLATLGTWIGIVIVWALMRLFKAERLIKWIFRNEDAINKAKQLFVVHGSKAIIISGLTPIPYSLILYVALATGLSLKKALISSTVSRIIRFYLVAVVLILFKNVANEEFVTTFVSGFTVFITISTIVGIVLFLYAGKRKQKQQAKILEEFEDYADMHDFHQPQA